MNFAIIIKMGMDPRPHKNPKKFTKIYNREKRREGWKSNAFILWIAMHFLEISVFQLGFLL